MDPITWEEFYSKNAAPADFESNKNLIESFCSKLASSDSSRVVLITVSVPLF